MNKRITDFIQKALQEDLGTGDVTSNACIQKNSTGNAKLLTKEECYISGINLAKEICHYYDDSLKFTTFAKDGDMIKKNTIIFTINGNKHSILATERLILNCMQRMSGITTKTRLFVNEIKDLNTNEYSKVM